MHEMWILYIISTLPTPLSSFTENGSQLGAEGHRGGGIGMVYLPKRVKCGYQWRPRAEGNMNRNRRLEGFNQDGLELLPRRSLYLLAP